MVLNGGKIIENASEINSKTNYKVMKPDTKYTNKKEKISNSSKREINSMIRIYLKILIIINIIQI